MTVDGVSCNCKEHSERGSRYLRHDSRQTASVSHFAPRLVVGMGAVSPATGVFS
ncbi:Protein of unknown function [Pyronema omphalodes CBS 100304]|uniref:Uncharacterized protein n=1 Tax=Pyronema omphalodes (strain CBS 100304) TaxID=1076935 RepID=U4LRX7_PYROM|nr:Protein of unknown function [Pyronema omphalodes CBS 100304]